MKNRQWLLAPRPQGAIKDTAPSGVAARAVALMAAIILDGKRTRHETADRPVPTLTGHSGSRWWTLQSGASDPSKHGINERLLALIAIRRGVFEFRKDSRPAAVHG